MIQREFRNERPEHQMNSWKTTDPTRWSPLKLKRLWPWQLQPVKAGRSSEYQVNFLLTKQATDWGVLYFVPMRKIDAKALIANRQMKKHASQCRDKRTNEWTNERTNERAYSLSVETTMESLCHMVECLVPASFRPANQQQRGRSCYWILSKIYSQRTRRRWHRHRHRIARGMPHW